MTLTNPPQSSSIQASSIALACVRPNKRLIITTAALLFIAATSSLTVTNAFQPKVSKKRMMHHESNHNNHHNDENNNSNENHVVDAIMEMNSYSNHLLTLDMSTRTLMQVRGGGTKNDTTNTTSEADLENDDLPPPSSPSSESILESYVEQVSQRDADYDNNNDSDKEKSSSSSSSPPSSQPPSITIKDTVTSTATTNDNFHNDNNVQDDDDDDDDDDENGIKLKKRERALNDPDSSDDDSDDHDDEEEDHDDDGFNFDIVEMGSNNDNSNNGHTTATTTRQNGNEELKVDIINLTQHDSNEEHDNDDEQQTAANHHINKRNQQNKQQSSSSLTNKLNPYDQALVDAFLPLFYPPPSSPKTNQQFMNQLASNAVQIDVASRRRLDRRTLYQSLLLEWRNLSTTKQQQNGETKQKSSSSSSKRNFIQPDISHQLKSSISLASQPLWRRHISQYQTTTSTTPTSTVNEDTNDNDKNNNRNDDDDTSQSSSSSSSDVPTTRSFYSTGIRLYSTREEEDDDDDEYDNNNNNQYMNNNKNGNNSNMNHMNNFHPSMWNDDQDDDEQHSSSSFGSTYNSNHDILSSSSTLSLLNTNTHKSLRSTLGMQETVAIALAHSYNCGFVVLDDVSLESVQESLVHNKNLDLDYNSNEVKFSSLIQNLIRLSNEGKLPRVMSKGRNYGSGSSSIGRISNRMERDLALGLDDPNDELAIESMKLMKDDEETWMALEDHDDNKEGKDCNGDDDSSSNGNPLPLVLFLRTDASPNLLKSKGTVDRLARECVNEDSIHLLILGRGIDATTVQLPPSSKSGSSNRNNLPSLKRPAIKPPPSIMGLPPSSNANNPFFPPQQQGTPPPMSMPQQQQQQHNPFAGMSNMPPPGLPGQQGSMPPGSFPPGAFPGSDNGNPFGFTQQNINASGVNDPEGSRRFNIFLARTVGKDGTPGIMGAIAPPQVGNLFPQMLAMQARENYIRSQEEGDSEEEIQKHEANMQRWAELMEQQEKHDSNLRSSVNAEDTLPPQFFNASISGGPGDMPSFMPMNGNNQFNGMVAPPPELIQAAIEQAVTDVMQQLTEMGNSDGRSDSGEENPLPPHLAKAFAQILSNDNLRRGIAENLARAAPALVDPRCQGVMLSVYVPPPPDHPNRGMMPGQQRPPQQQSQGKKSSKKGKSGSLGAPGMGGWLNKILSTSSSSANSSTDSKSDNSVSGDEDVSENEAEDEEEKNHKSFINDTLSKVADKKMKKRDRNARAAAVAAATAMINQHQEDKEKEKKKRKPSSSSTSSLSPEQKIEKHLTRLQALCKPTPMKTPSDPVRSRSWDAWTIREYGAIIFRKNRRALNAVLSQRRLKIDVNVGTKGMGSILRQMLSVKDVSHEMDEVITCAVEFEAARSQRMQVRIFFIY